MKAVWVAALAALALGGCERNSDAAFGQRVRAYLLAHPEVLAEAADRLRAQETAQQAQDEKQALATARAQIPRLRAQIEHDPRDFVAHPNGRVTVTEFYDYRCPHCQNIAPRVLALVRTRPDVRFVFKEMPIFGPVSEAAARGAFAVRAAGGDSLGYYAATMAAKALDEAAIRRIALAHGARAADLDGVEPPAVKAKLADNAELFKRLGQDGTPTFIVGDEAVIGEDSDGLDAAIARAGAAGVAALRPSSSSPAPAGASR